jgi:hypothetical protein
MLSDIAAMLTGSLGMLPSASLGEIDAKTKKRRSLFEPVHGSAPDIAGKGLANPIAMISSFGMALRYSCDMGALADKVDSAIAAVLATVARVRFVEVADAAEQRAMVRAYLRTVARRIAWEQIHRARLERAAREPAEHYDPLPMFEARSTLRALDLSPTALAFFQALTFYGSVPLAAARMGWPQGTGYTRRNALRRDALAALRRVR